MADTIRTLADLDGIFADTGAVSIDPQAVRDLIVSLLVYGEIGSGAKAAITVGTAYQVMDLTLAGVVGRGLNIDTANHRISGIPCDMKCEVTAEVSFTGANNTTFDFGVHVNGVLAARLADSCRIVASGQIGAVKFSSAVQLAAGDALDLRVKAGAAGSSFTLARGGLRVRRIGVE